MKRLFAAILAAAALALTFAQPAFPQASGQVQAITPLTRDLGALRTLASQGPATVTTADQNGLNVSRVICVWRQSTGTVSSSTQFKIQNKDAASGQYYDLITSASIPVGTATNVIAAGAGLVDETNVRKAIPIAKTWRVSITVSGSTAVVSGTIGCSVQ